MNVITLYTRPGCHLCDAVEQVIRQVRRRRPFDFVIRNILEDPADHERYKHDIPVVTLDGKEIARHRLTPVELESALDRE